MTDAVVGANAPADNSAPIEAVAAPPTPLSDAPAAAEIKAEPAKPALTTREALRAAAAKVDADEAAKAAAGDKAVAPDRAKDGKFAGKDAAAAKGADKAAPAAAASAAAVAVKPGADPALKDGEKPAAAAAAKPAVDPNAPKHAAPERFSPDAKAVWDTAPEPVKAEVTRMHRELTQGFEKHRAAAEKFESVKEFDELATRSGTSLKAALTRYVNLEQALRQNPLQGLEAVCSNMGTSLRDVARIVLDQPADQQQSQSDGVIRRLQQQVEQLTQQVGGVTNTFKQQREGELHDHVAKWAEGRVHFDLIAPHIAAEMRDGATSLDDAEAKVFEKFPAFALLAKDGAKPAPAADSAAASAAAVPDLEAAQTRKGQKSVTGAPGSGSEPAAQPRSSSIKEALKRAAAKAG